MCARGEQHRMGLAIALANAGHDRGGILSAPVVLLLDVAGDERLELLRPGMVGGLPPDHLAQRLHRRLVEVDEKRRLRVLRDGRLAPERISITME
jgi:hypothetical protein